MERQFTDSTDSDRTYQIFKRESDNTTVCIESVKGIHEARKRIDEARRMSPQEEHFVFDPLTEKTIDPAELTAGPDPLAP